MSFNTSADLIQYAHPDYPGTAMTLTDIDMHNLGRGHVAALRAALYRLARDERAFFNNGATSGVGSSAEDLYFHIFKERVFNE